MKPAYWDEATRALGQRDRVLRKLIRAHPHIHLRRRHDPFTTLARAIVGQQISVKAADSIWRRFVATVAPGATIDRLPAPRSCASSRPRASLRCAIAGCRGARSTTCAISLRVSIRERSTPRSGASSMTTR